MKINLATNGIFPITKDIKGNLIKGLPDTGYPIAGTIQGEGKLIGTTSLFVRTSGCNLRCAWVGVDGNGSTCDTPYTSFDPQKNQMEIEDVIKIINHNNNEGAIQHIIVSGGEPTLQNKNLAELLKRLKEEGYHTTIETNGTLFNEEVAKYVDLFSISPKLASSTPREANLKETGVKYNANVAARHERDRKNISSIQNYINACYSSEGEFKHKDFQLKFVVTCEDDIREIENDFLNKLEGHFPTDIILMPEGITPEDLMARSDFVCSAAIERGWTFSPRLHTLLWGTKVGV